MLLTMDAEIQSIVALDLALFMLLFCVAFAVKVDSYIIRTNSRRVYLIVAIVMFLLVEPQITANYGDVLYGSHISFWKTLWTAAGYILRPVILYLFIGLTGNGRLKKIPAAVLIVNALFVLSAFFAPWVFAHDDAGNFRRGPLWFIPFAASFLLIGWLLAGTISRYRVVRRGESLIPVFISVVIIGAVYLDTTLAFGPQVSFLTVAMTVGTVFFYIWMHLQFVREHEDALKAEQRIRIMISQIQPHFLFNTLSTIQALTETDPEKASEVIGEFAVYLRQNIDSLNQASLIPVKKELEHTRVYSDIEKVRFPSIRIDYEIEDEDFLIPPLTIQPIVENAIRHGVRGKKNGWVSVSTYNEGGMHVISICDNGKGFDAKQLAGDGPPGDHIGFRNVRERIIDMTGGTVTIESETGEGTTVTIRVPQ